MGAAGLGAPIPSPGLDNLLAACVTPLDFRPRPPPRRPQSFPKRGRHCWGVLPAGEYVGCAKTAIFVGGCHRRRPGAAHFKLNSHPSECSFRLLTLQTRVSGRRFQLRPPPKPFLFFGPPLTCSSGSHSNLADTRSEALPKRISAANPSAGISASLEASCG